MEKETHRTNLADQTPGFDCSHVDTLTFRDWDIASRQPVKQISRATIDMDEQSQITVLDLAERY